MKATKENKRSECHLVKLRPLSSSSSLEMVSGPARIKKSRVSAWNYAKKRSALEQDACCWQD